MRVEALRSLITAIIKNYQICLFFACKFRWSAWYPKNINVDFIGVPGSLQN